MGASISTVMSSAIPTAVDVALKGAVLLALAGLATTALWRASAAVRHLVWSLAMAGLLALPVLSALLPQWRVLPQWSHVAQPPSAVNVLQPPPAVNDIVQNPPVGHLQSEGDSPGLASLPASAQPRAAVPHQPTRPWSDWLLPFWILGAALAFLPVVVGRLALWRLSRSARPIGSGVWNALLQTLAQQMRLRRSIILLEIDRPVMPMAWGIRRARVLLPAESEKWTSERRRAVLLHEIAHVRRRDCLTQFLTNLACAMHWFNPLAWLARRRMVAERERACDDLVLAAGFEPSDYAQHLLQIASSLRGDLLTSGAAIAMARPSKLEGRLLAVLDGKRSRRGLTRSLVLAGLVLTIGIAVPLACLRPQGTDATLPEGRKEVKTPAETKYPAPTEKTNEPAWGEAVNGLECRLLPETQTVEVADGTKQSDIKVYATYEVCNISDKLLKFLPLQTPLDESRPPHLEVTGPSGKMVSQLFGFFNVDYAISKDSFVTVKPGESRSRRFRLQYDFSQRGTYRITAPASKWFTTALQMYYHRDAALMKANPDNVWTDALTSNTAKVMIVRPDEMTESTCGEKVEGLQMSISVPNSAVPVGKQPAFAIAFRNVGEKDFVLNLGMMLANGKKMFPAAIKLILTDALGRKRELMFSDKHTPGVAGRVDDYVVPLPAGAKFSLAAGLDQYWCPAANEFQIKLPQGKYRLSAEFTGTGATFVNGDSKGAELMNYWKGTVRSNDADFEVTQSEAEPAHSDATAPAAGLTPTGSAPAPAEKPKEQPQEANFPQLVKESEPVVLADVEIHGLDISPEQLAAVLDASAQKLSQAESLGDPSSTGRYCTILPKAWVSFLKEIHSRPTRWGFSSQRALLASGEGVTTFHDMTEHRLEDTSDGRKMLVPVGKILSGLARVVPRMEKGKAEVACRIEFGWRGEGLALGEDDGSRPVTNPVFKIQAEVPSGGALFAVFGKKNAPGELGTEQLFVIFARLKMVDAQMGPPAVGRLVGTETGKAVPSVEASLIRCERLVQGQGDQPRGVAFPQLRTISKDDGQLILPMFSGGGTWKFWYKVAAAGYAPMILGPYHPGQEIGDIKLLPPIEISGEIRGPARGLIRYESRVKESRDEHATKHVTNTVAPFDDGRVTFRVSNLYAGGTFQIAVNFDGRGAVPQKPVFEIENITESIHGLLITPEGSKMADDLTELGQRQPERTATNEPPSAPTEKPKEATTASAPPIKPEATAAESGEKSMVVISGRVIDGQTGKPVEQYTLQDGHPNPKEPSGFSWGGGRSGKWPGGKFTEKMGWANGQRFWLRVLADGYLPEPVTSGPVTAPATMGDLVVRLKRGETVRGRVIDHTGAPVADATVFLAGNQQLELTNGQVAEYSRFSGSKTVTDKEGRFVLTGSGGANDRIVVTSAELSLWQAPVKDAGKEQTIQLPQPATASISYDIDGAPEQGVFRLELRTWDMPDWKGVVQSEQKVKCANKGECVVRHLTPGVYDVARAKELRVGDMGRGVLCDRSLTVNLEPGKTTKLDFVRKEGQPISGEVVGLGALELPGAFIYVRPAEATGEPDLGNRSEWMLRTFDALTCDAHGQFKTERIPPGEYTLVVNAYKEEPRSNLKEPGIHEVRTGWRLPDFIGTAKISVTRDNPPPTVRVDLKPWPSAPTEKAGTNPP